MISPADPQHWALWYPAPAKLNLFLHVVGRRPDGYHCLQTVFRFIDLADKLHFSRREDGLIRLASPVAGVPDEDDLCVRAAKALRAATGFTGGVDIHLDKRIPIGGGLGGGSSDAATTLLVLNRLWSLGVERKGLIELGVSLGADVAVFLSGFNAFAEGIGEELVPIVLPPAWYVVMVPPVAVPTATIFSAPELTRNTKTITISGFSAGPGAYQPGFGHNDLEPVVCSRFPQVAEHLAWLKTQGDARVTGSGACVFAEFSTEMQANSVASRMPSGMRGMVARGLERHPLEDSGA